jgi:hypothetical protein
MKPLPRNGGGFFYACNVALPAKERAVIVAAGKESDLLVDVNHPSAWTRTVSRIAWV